MILDSSAIIAMVLREPGWEEIATRLAAAPMPAVAAPTLTETAAVLHGKLGRSAAPTLLRFLQEAGVTIIPFGEEHWRAAVDAFERFGKGRHRARLNFGDCLTYAIAKLAGQPLLCVGDDFRHTDLPLA